VAVRCGQGLGSPHRTPPPARDHPAAPPLPASAPNGFLSAQAARDLLVASGITVIKTVCCQSAATAAAAADRIGYPAVVKVDHPDLVHKSDADGVRLGLGSGAEVAEAAGELLRLATGARVLVQRQHRGVELLVGAVRDPEFGPMVVAGFGGVLVETQRDVQLAVAPVDMDQARAMLSSLRGAALFGGLRGSPPIPLDFVAEIVVAVGHLMLARPEIAELDLNPVLAGPHGCVAIDWRISIR
jgi:acetate---CoA ligase (ADP-forming)